MMRKNQNLEEILHKPTCPHCHSKNVYGLTRIVGYYSRINNWLNSKKQELKARKKGNYEIKA